MVTMRVASKYSFRKSFSVNIDDKNGSAADSMRSAPMRRKSENIETETKNQQNKQYHLLGVNHTFYLSFFAVPKISQRNQPHKRRQTKLSHQFHFSVVFFGCALCICGTNTKPQPRCYFIECAFYPFCCSPTVWIWIVGRTTTCSGSDK